MAAASKSPSLSAPIQSNSPRSRQSRRPSAARGVPSPPPLSLSGSVDQDQIVTSSSTTSSDTLPSNEAIKIVAEPSSLAEDGGSDGGADAQLDGAKKPAWNKPGVVAEAGAVMGAESWPALWESTRASPKTSSSNGSIHISEELAVVSLSSPKEVSTSISTPNPNPNHVPSRQRSMKRGGSSSSHNSMPANDNSSQARSSVVDASPPNQGKTSGSDGESSRDSPNKDGGQKGGTHVGNESQPQRSSFRRSNSGPLTRGDGSYHHGRRDYERGKQDWGNRSFGSREQRVGSRPFLRGPSSNAPFIPSPPPPSVAGRPFVAPVVYTEMPSPVFYVPGPFPDSLRHMPMVPIQSMFFPMPDPHLPSKIVNQIDYYFSNENLVKDTFLRQNMDAEGWVSIKLIAGFKKVMQLTDNVQLILDAIKASNVLEVQGDKVRRKSDWMKWIMPPVQTTVTSPQSSNRSSQNMLAAHLNIVTLDEKAAT